MERDMTIRSEIRAFINDKLSEVDNISCSYERFLTKSGVYNTIKDIEEELHQELCDNRHNLKK